MATDGIVKIYVQNHRTGEIQYGYTRLRTEDGDDFDEKLKEAREKLLGLVMADASTLMPYQSFDGHGIINAWTSHLPKK